MGGQVRLGPRRRAQDVNFAQYTWLKTLGSHTRRMFVVGDDDQSICGWRGADVAFIRRFRRDFPDAVAIRLEENFRSTGHILATPNAIIAEDKARLGKTLFTRKGQGTPVELMSFRDGDADAAGLADTLIARKGEGARWAEMAVLYRNNFLSRAFEEALMRAKIPYRLVGDVGFYARAEIKDALALLRLAAMLDDRQSDEALRRVINEPQRGFGAKAIEILERDASFFVDCQSDLETRRCRQDRSATVGSILGVAKGRAISPGPGGAGQGCRARSGAGWLRAVRNAIPLSFTDSILGPRFR
jgi:DNA helicase II / ATP-dependent DNA helicase PcrA